MNRLWNILMATIIVARANAKARHWYMKGNEFFGAHVYFDTIVDTIEDFEDYLAERKSAKDIIGAAKLSECLDLSLIKEVELEGKSIKLHCADELAEIETICGAVFDIIERGIFDPADESGVTNWCDELENCAYRLAKFLEIEVKIRKIVISDES